MNTSTKPITMKMLLMLIILELILSICFTAATLLFFCSTVLTPFLTAVDSITTLKLYHETI